MGSSKAGGGMSELGEEEEERIRSSVGALTLAGRYDDVPEFGDVVLTTDYRFRTPKYDFTDDELMNQPGIRLDRYTDGEIARLGRRVVVPMVSSGFTEEGAAAILVLAYHLRSPGTDYKEYVFADGDRYTTIEDEKYSDYRDIGEMTVVQGPSAANPISISPIDDPAKEAALYSYVAASMLRLFTKPAANYVKAWNRIIEGFPKSYEKSVHMFTMMRMLPPTPNEQPLKHLANWFSMDRGAKVTLYRLLHMSNSNQEHLGMKNFLYDMHLSYTGLHVVDMLFKICEMLGCAPGDVLAAIDTTWETQRQLTSLRRVLELHADDGEEHQRRMWRYGRVFDEAFMAHLQTKECRTLVYTFGEALRSEAPETHSEILRIAQLAHLSEDIKKRCAVAAQQLLRRIKAGKKTLN